MTYREYLCLYYDGVSSNDFGVKSVSVSQGMYSEHFLPSTNIITEKVRGRDKPYFIEADRDVMSLEINLAFYDNWDSVLDSGNAEDAYDDTLTDYSQAWEENEYSGKEIRIVAGSGTGQRRIIASNTEDTITVVDEWSTIPDYTSEYEISYRRDIKTWIMQEKYKPLYFEGAEDRIYYCIYSGSPQIVHNGAKQGYIGGLQFICNDINAYKQQIETSALIIENTGDLAIYPEIWIEKTSVAGDIQLSNQTDDKTMIFTDLALNETVYINNENEIIETDIVGEYRYNSHNNVFLRLLQGRNVLTKVGDFDILIKYQEKVL